MPLPARRAALAAHSARASRAPAPSSIARLCSSLIRRAGGPQKCSRFQPLAAFDGPKRTCARQLALQNARRAARSGGGTDDDIVIGGASLDEAEGSLARTRAPYSRRSSVKAAVAAAEGAVGVAAPPAAAQQLLAAFSPQLLAALGQNAMPQQGGAMQLQACVCSTLPRAPRGSKD